MELPQEMRDLLVEQLDDRFSDRLDSTDPEAIAAAVVETLETVADEVDESLTHDLISKLEASGDLEGSLVEVLEDSLSVNDDFEYTGEDVVVVLEKLCEIEWVTGEDEDSTSYGGVFGEDDEDY